MKPTSSAAGIKVKDVISLVAHEASDPHKILEKWFDWQHSRALEVAKWSLAAASGLVAAVIVASIKSAPAATPSIAAPPSALAGFKLVIAAVSNWSAIIALAAGMLLVVGITALRRAWETQRQYVVAQGLLARLKAIAPFLSRAGEKADIGG